MRRCVFRAIFGLLLATAVPVSAQPAGPSQSPPAATPAPMPAASPSDYTQDAAWLCRPGRQDACAIDLAATVVAADGTLTPEPFTANPRASIDCFYVYPTVSTDPGTFSDMTADAAERTVVAQQFARFASVCRPYAPLYRQVTLAGLRQRMASGGVNLGNGTEYDDVRDAWRQYLAHDNGGRGVVLVGHSQGAYILIQLLRREIEGTPAQRRLVSAILMGTTVSVPPGARSGGTFKNLAGCQSARDVGCIISFSTYRATLPPPPTALFGRHGGGQDALCTNPVTFTEAAGDLRPYLSAGGQTITSRQAQAPWVAGATIATPFVTVPGLISARCARNEYASYLEITVRGNPADPRADDIAGDLGPPGKPNTSWGLHLVDVNLTIGNLIDTVAQQAQAWAARRP